MAKRITLDDFAALAMSEFGTLDLRKRQMKLLAANYDICIPSKVKKNKVGVGLFRIDGDPAKGALPEKAAPAATPVAAPVVESNPVVSGVMVDPAGVDLAYESFNGIKVFSTPLTYSLIPDQDKNFVAWGNYHLIKKLLSADQFLSIYMVGETGNGKTFNFEQAAAQLKKEIIVVNFTAMTDEDDLVGGFRLVNGDTVWVDGPVIEAMKRGAILLLDEVDLATEAVMALQSVLQGKSYFIKKLGRLITPAPGFKVVATANTKGDGDGDYVYTNVMNKAFLDRFKVLLEQPYPSIAVERKIVNRYVSNNCPQVDDLFVANITRFVDVVRNSYKEGAISEQISTRRLIDMTQMYGLLGNAQEAIKLTTNRFPEEVQNAMLALWETIHTTPDPEGADVDPDAADGTATTSTAAPEIPF